MEDKTRYAMLRQSANRPESQQDACNRLARRIQRADESNLDTLASARVMRWFAILVVGALWRLCRGADHLHFVTLIPRGFSVTPDQLTDIDPTKANQWLRMTLRRYGAEQAEGWIFAYLEGEYNPATDMIQLHWHAIVCGAEMLDAFRRLRQHMKFRRVPGVANNPDGIVIRIQAKPVKRAGLPDLLGYVVKRAWWSKWRADDETGSRKNQNRRSRIPEPAHSKVLLWLDRWKFGDLALLIGLRIGRDGLQPIQPT